jgi:hypothetical protein
MKKDWMAGAVKHPGIEKRAAAKEGMSTHSYLEAHKASPGKAGQRARLGLEFEREARMRKHGSSAM